MNGKTIRCVLALPFLCLALEGRAAALANSSIDGLSFRAIDLTPGDGNTAGWINHNGPFSHTGLLASFLIPNSSGQYLDDQDYAPGFLSTLPAVEVQDALGTATASATPDSLFASVTGLGFSNWNASVDSSTGYSGEPGSLAIEILPYTAFGINATLKAFASDNGAEHNGAQDWAYAAASLNYFGDYADTVELSVLSPEDWQPTTVSDQRMVDIILTNHSGTSKMIYFTALSTAAVRAVPEPESLAMAAAGLMVSCGFIRSQRKRVSSQEIKKKA